MKKRIVCLLLAVLLTLSLCACGGKKSGDPNHFDFGKYAVDYKGACLMYNESGADALVLTFDFTNNSKETASYGWTVYEKAEQNGAELESTYVITDMETFAGVSDQYFTDVEPEQTLEVSTAYKLNGMSEVTFTMSDLFDKYTYTITVNPAELERVDNEFVDWGDTGSDEGDSGEVSFTDWWSGDWYGWWIIKDGTGAYDEFDGYWWDACARFEVNDDLTGTVKIWDTDGNSEDLCGEIDVSFSESGTGEHGTMFSEGGAFVDDVLEHADWIVDPALAKADNLLWIDGTYEGEEGDYSYEIYLRPWGVLWDDITEDVIPYEDATPYTYDWYVSLVNAGAAMPDSFDATVDAGDAPAQTEPDATETEAPVFSGEMKEQSVDMITSSENSKATVTFSIPDGVWSIEKKQDYHFKIVDYPDPTDYPFDTSFLWIELADSEEKINFYENDYENVIETDSYTIGGIEMPGRIYDYIGYEAMQEYYGQTPSGAWVRIRFVKVTDENRQMCYNILDTMSFK